MNLRALLVGAALAAGVAGQASAAIFTGIWDPPYNQAPFTSDFGWRGSVTFFVPDSCELAGDGSVDNATACSGNAAITAANVELYDTDTNDLLATLPFSPGSMTLSTLYYLGGELVNVDSGVSSGTVANFEPGVDPADYNFDKSLQFKLIFTSTGPRLGAFCGDSFDSCESQNDDDNNRPTFTVTRVPEPGTLALIGLAAAGLGLSRGRRRAGSLAA